MSRPVAGAAVSVERFFQFALWGLVVSGYLAVAGSGYLDTPTIAMTGAGLLLRALLIAGVLDFDLSQRLVVILTLAYVAFFPLDYLFLSRAFVNSTVHLVFFLAVIQILTSRNNRDYFFMATIAFLELLAAAILSTNSNFFFFLALYLLFAMAAFTSSEIRRSMQKRQVVARNGFRRFHSRLAALTAIITFGILALTAGLFFILPRTADAAFQRLVSKRFFLPGFSNRVTLGEIGEIKNTSRPVMHVLSYHGPLPPGQKWRGGTLSDFNGRSWFEPAGGRRQIAAEKGGRFQLATDDQLRRPGDRLNYRVNVNGIDSDVLMFVGVPETVYMRQATLVAGSDGSFRLGRALPEGFFYDVYSFPGESRAAEDLWRNRRQYLQLPPLLDPRIPELARRVTENALDDVERAHAINRYLTHSFGYTLELPSHEVPDPLASFLFQRRKGHCEYFASAMAVMLRTLGIPSRLVTGFQGGIFNPLTELYVIRASDAHSWVEAWLPGRGWTTFDPTPPDPNPGEIAILTRLALYADAVETFWQEWVVSYDLGHQATLADRMQQAGRRAGARWFDRLVDLAVNWKPRTQAWFQRYGFGMFLALAGAALIPLAGPRLWRLARMRLGARRLRRGRANVADATLFYERMLKLLKRRGYQKPAWFTPREFACSLPPGTIGALVSQFTAAYNALRFGGQADAAPQLSMLLEELEKQPR
jgi:transglutaminase-like putative cysteine protease